MLGDCAHQPSLVGEVGTSPLMSLSRRSTFDEDSFYSPIKSKSEHRATRPALSPQHIHKLPTVHDKVLEWFLGLIESRRLKASACTGMICAFLFVVSVTALHFSVRSPLLLFRDMFSSFLALSTWISGILIGMLSFGTSLLLLHLLAKAEQLQRISWRNLDAWLCFFTVLVYNIIHSVAVMKLTNFPSNENRFLSGLLLHSAVVSAFSSIFRNDFQLNFSGVVTQLGLMHTVVGMFAIGYESVLVSAFREAVRIAFITTSVGCIAGFFSYGLSSLLFLFSVSFHVCNITVIVGQLFATKALLKLVRHIVMKPICFPLPPSFAVHTPTPEQTRTLTIVLDSQHPLLKLFAFTDLRRVAWTDRNRRLEVFSLSQPGGHPRNWTNISTACINILDRVRSELQSACARLESCGLDRDRGDMSDEEFAEVDREMLMMPQKSRKQIYSSAVRQRHSVAIRPLARRPVSFVLQQNNWWRRIASLSCEQEVVSRYDANIVVLAVESLYMFVVESYEEDRYGVVLKDHEKIIGILVQFIQTVDKYFRLKASQTLPSGSDSTLKQIDASLQAALLRITGKFGDHLRALNLSQEQIQTIRMVCQVDI